MSGLGQPAGGLDLLFLNVLAQPLASGIARMPGGPCPCDKVEHRHRWTTRGSLWGAARCGSRAPRCAGPAGPHRCDN